MLIRWVNHASFVLETGKIKLICDPWIEGTAFNNGWRLVSPTKFAYRDFAGVTHIWFSHEHPDHFSPSNLRSIPEEFRRRITVLFHRTKDKRVIKVCAAMGFATREMNPEEWIDLDGVRLICGLNGQIDSWLGIEAEGVRILNMNDCVYDTHRELEHIHELMGPVEVLLTQFSYANWIGNRDETEIHQKAAENKRSEMRKQVEMFRPNWVIPFASFVWFSHEENFYINKAVNRISAIFRYCATELKVRPVVLYPGDLWQVGKPHDSDVALAMYEADYDRVLNGEPEDRAMVVSDAKLLEAAAQFGAKLKQRNNRFLLRMMPSATAYLTDKDQTAVLSCDALRLSPGRAKNADIHLGSDSLAYCLRFGWGGDTLQVNGRYQVPAGGNPSRFFQIFRIAGINTADELLNFPVALTRGLRRLVRPIARRRRAQLYKPAGEQA
jgi:UDP-MurNAc hydroxylase